MKDSNPDLGNCEYYCQGQNKAVSEVFYKRICGPCFRQMMKETQEAIREELNKEDDGLPS